MPSAFRFTPLFIALTATIPVAAQADEDKLMASLKGRPSTCTFVMPTSTATTTTLACVTPASGARARLRASSRATPQA